jgi:threonine/homoserine/homoserine lactone efflux protein
MSLTTVLPLLLFVVVATASPGGATTTAAASGARFGVRRSLPLIGGLVIGLATLAVASAIGLAGLLLAAPFMQVVLKVVGTVYLLWLAWQIGRRGAPDLNRALAQPPSFMSGACLQWLNPKAWAVTLGAAASFAMVAAGPKQLAALLGGAFGVVACFALTFWCAAGTVVARRLRTETHWRVFNATMAVLLIASILPMWR